MKIHPLFFIIPYFTLLIGCFILFEDFILSKALYTSIYFFFCGIGIIITLTPYEYMGDYGAKTIIKEFVLLAFFILVASSIHLYFFNKPWEDISESLKEIQSTVKPKTKE